MPYVIPGLRQAVVALRNVGLVVRGHPDPARGRGRRPLRAGARAGPAPREVVRGRRPRAAQRRGHPGRPGPAGRLGRRGGQGRRRLRRPAVGQDRLRGYPAQERHRRRPAGRPARRGRRPRGLPGGDRGRPGRRQGRRASWSARCAVAEPSFWSAWSATRSGARCSPWRSAGCSSRCCRTRRSRRCRSRPHRPAACWTGCAAGRCSTAPAARAPADLDALAAVIARIGDLALALGDDLESLEVNPLLVDGARIEALDAVVTWREHS